MANYTGFKRRMTDSQIIEMYQKLHDSDTVSFHAGCAASTVIRICRAAGVAIARRGGYGRAAKAAYDYYGNWIAKIPEAEIVHRYRNGESGPALAAAAGIRDHAVYTCLRRHGVRLRPGAPEQIRLGLIQSPLKGRSYQAMRGEKLGKVRG